MWSLLGLLWIHRRYEHKNIIHLFKFQCHSVYFKMQQIAAPSHSFFIFFNDEQYLLFNWPTHTDFLSPSSVNYRKETISLRNRGSLLWWEGYKIKHAQTAVTTSIVITEEGEVWSPPKLLPPGEVAAHSSSGLGTQPICRPQPCRSDHWPLRWTGQSFSTSGSILPQHGLQQRACTDIHAASIETATVHKPAVTPE